MSAKTDDLLFIPPMFRRERAAPQPREFSPEVEQSREAHRIAQFCRKLLDKDRKRRSRAARKRRRTA